jgi:cell wall-associated NlpC family hydrolase
MEWADYLRIKYRHGARGWVEGDCLNLVLRFYEREFGIQLPDDQCYPPDWDRQGLDLLRRTAGAWGFAAAEAPASFGDVILFMTGALVNHTGVVVDARQGYFIHCGREGTLLANYRADSHWLRRVYGYYRYTRGT